MKKTLFLFALIVSINAFSQCNIDTASMTITAELRHWYYYIDAHGSQMDSVIQKNLRAFKTQAIAQCGQCLDSTVSVTIPNLPGRWVEFIYATSINTLTFGDYMLDGNTDAVRRTMFTAIRSSSNACIQAMVTRVDNARRQLRNDSNKRARTILIQNN